MQFESSNETWWSAFAIAAAISLVLLAVTAYPTAYDLLREMNGAGVASSVLDGETMPWPLVLALAGFGVACLLLHLAVAIVALGLAWITKRAGLSGSRRSLTFLWVFALASALVMFSAQRFPRSHAADYYGWAATRLVSGWSIADLWLLFVSALACAMACRALVRNFRPTRLAGPVAIGVVAMVAAGLAIPGMLETSAHAKPFGRPNVILLGIDSLRLEALQRPELEPVTRNLRRALNGAAVFTDTTSPLSRTFPAWVSILTGRLPNSTGAYFNLSPRARVDADPTIASLLQERGYRTVLATDEVRFSNIDQSYGFDEVVTPSIGAADFLVGQLGDIALVNLVADSAIGGVLFPQLHTNRAVANTYRPSSFVARLKRSVEFEQPTFLVVHLTSPHWPYYTAGSHELDESLSWSQRTYRQYLDGLAVADAQLGQLMDWLDREGALDDALVVFLSDHGEALGRAGDSLLEHAADPALTRIKVPTSGHGCSVLSPTQFQVLLGWRGFGSSAARVKAGYHPDPAGLEDIKPTVLDLLRLPAPQPLDGRSLAGVVRGGASEDSLKQRIRFTETDFNTPRTLAGDFNPHWIAQESAHYYRVNERNGYAELRDEYWDGIAALKERAAIKGDWLLASLPALEGKQVFVLSRRDGSYARIVDAANVDPVADELLHALRTRYGAAIKELPRAGG